MGSTAENLHDRFPEITKDRADAFAALSQQRVQSAYDAGVIQESLVAVATPSSELGWGLAVADEQPRPGTTVDALGQPYEPPSGRMAASRQAMLLDSMMEPPRACLRLRLSPLSWVFPLP